MTTPHEGPRSEESVAIRPLKLLVVQIKADVEKGEEAGKPYFQAAGEKLIEARDRLGRGKFDPWQKQNFKFSRATAFRYMKMADPEVVLGSPKSQNEFFRGERKKKGPKPKESRPHSYDPPQDREARRELALELVEAGFKALLKKYHPDQNGGGTSEAAAQLNAVRDQMRALAERVT